MCYAGTELRHCTATSPSSRNSSLDKNYRYDAVDQGEIDQICACNGAIVVIPENFWLVGCDKKLGSQSGEELGIRFVVDTIVEINRKTGTKEYDNVAIGADFDGLADAPDDLFKPSQLGALIQALQSHPLIEPEHAKKITSGNAMRMLKEGWT